MKLIRFVLILVAVGLVFVFGFGYGRWYSTRPAAKPGRKILYYVDAMHPWYKSDKPGIAFGSCFNNDGCPLQCEVAVWLCQ